jgi:hypothetical protein
MSDAELPRRNPSGVASDAAELVNDAHHQRRDLHESLLLALATLWLLDAVLQIQRCMFTPGSSGLSGMLKSVATGNPGWIADTIQWNASNVSHEPVLSNTFFALIQFLIAFGIIAKRTRKFALSLSIGWAVGVWWFGEGLGATFSGGATPFAGGPGPALFYALLAVLLWPSEGSDGPFVAARTVGLKAAKSIWVAVWTLLALLAVVASDRSTRSLHDLLARMKVGQPGLLTALDRYVASLFLHHEGALAVSLGIVCSAVAVGVLLSPRLSRATLTLAVVVFAFIWVTTQNFGGILAGGATDPNSGPLVIMLLLAYWPLTGTRSASSDISSDSPVRAKEANAR